MGHLLYATHHARVWGYEDELGKEESVSKGTQILISVYNRAL